MERIAFSEEIEIVQLGCQIIKNVITFYKNLLKSS
jgi:hypothetical protein